MSSADVVGPGGRPGFDSSFLSKCLTDARRDWVLFVSPSTLPSRAGRWRPDLTTGGALGVAGAPALHPQNASDRSNSAASGEDHGYESALCPLDVSHGVLSAPRSLLKPHGHRRVAGAPTSDAAHITGDRSPRRSRREARKCRVSPGSKRHAGARVETDAGTARLMFKESI